MSSFIGHSITAGAVFLARKNPKEDFSLKGLAWLACLGIAAIAPDLDYFLPFLHKSNFGGARVSNSFLYSILFPSFVCLVMWIARTPKGKLASRAIQIFVAGISHIILDYLVGVHPSPLFWPLSDATYASPVGILPSAGALSLTNYYFYRNLGIELGVLVPIYLFVCLWIWRYPKNLIGRLSVSGALIAVSSICILIAIGLSR